MLNRLSISFSFSSSQEGSTVCIANDNVIINFTCYRPQDPNTPCCDDQCQIVPADAMECVEGSECDIPVMCKYPCHLSNKIHIRTNYGRPNIWHFVY